jgi:hypothetical protein
MQKQPQNDMRRQGQSQAQSREGKQPNEGEGNRTAAREYNQRTEKFVHSGKVEDGAKRAERAVEGSERDELNKAEEAGKKHAKH